MKKAQRYEVKVWFATASAPRVVAVFTDHEAALREARAYLNTDARGVWVNHVEVK